MYQLPPGFVPVLVSNTGSLQPLMSIPPQQVPQAPAPAAAPIESIPPPPQQASLSVPQDSTSRRSSEASQGQQMVIIQQAAAVDVEPPEDPSPSPQPMLAGSAVGGGGAALTLGESDNVEAVDEREEDATQTKDVRTGTLKFVVMPSSSLYSSTSSLSSTFSCADHHLSSLHVQPHRYHLNLDDQTYQQGIRKSSVPNNEVHLHQEALLRRGSLPASMLLNQEQQSRLSTRRSSSGAIVPPQLATLRENRGDSDISLEDLSQVRQTLIAFLFFHGSGDHESCGAFPIP